MKSRVVGVWIFAALGCSGVQRPGLNAVARALPLPELAKPSIDATIKDTEEKEEAQGLIDEMFLVIQSPEFSENLKQLDGGLSELWLSPFGETASVAEVARAYLGQDRKSGPVPSTLVWGESEQTGPMEGHPDKAVIELSRGKLAQWRSASTVHKSCAINTLAHEFSHTVSSSVTDYAFLFVDRGRPWATFMDRPLASYTLGAVAQCTYLKRHGSELGLDLKQCIQRWGTNNFYSADCDP
jgi:hypothetical protein